MSQPAPKYPIDPPTETDAAREARLAWESARLAEGEESYAKGDFIADDALDAWLDAWVAGKPST